MALSGSLMLGLLPDKPGVEINFNFSYVLLEVEGLLKHISIFPLQE